MEYPAIVYTLNKVNNSFANDKPYRHVFSYTVTLIDECPDNDVFYKMIELTNCEFDRHYDSDNMSHDVFTIKY